MKWMLTGLIIMFVACSAVLYERPLLAGLAWNAKLPRIAGMLNVSDASLSAKLGEYYFSRDHYDIVRAERNYRAATVFAPYAPYNHYQLGRVEFLMGAYDKALFDIRRELAINPTFGKSYYMQGLILGYMRQYPESAKSFGKFIETDPINWAGYNDLSWVYFSAGNFAAAKQTAEIGLGYAQGNPWLLNSLGVAELGLKDPKSAHDAFQNALSALEKIGPNDWGRAYPGNDPRIYTQGYDSMKESIEVNLEKSATPR